MGSEYIKNYEMCLEANEYWKQEARFLKRENEELKKLLDTEKSLNGRNIPDESMDLMFLVLAYAVTLLTLYYYQRSPVKAILYQTIASLDVIASAVTPKKPVISFQ
uniref:Uncharacterized protein n=1 Tax=Panagrolaimus superbus TaxID=310955 RepID=A0A914YF00_9BILA